jgi:hypothetical protein
MAFPIMILKVGWVAAFFGDLGLVDFATLVAFGAFATLGTATGASAVGAVSAAFFGEASFVVAFGALGIFTNGFGR